MRKILRGPIVTSVARWAKKEPFIWDGVYERFDQAPVAGEGFASEAWLSDTERYTRSAVAAIGNVGLVIPENVPPYHALLASLVALREFSDRPVRVLDFGGGMGIGFANVRRCTSPESKFEYVVVDNAESCARGRQLFKDFPSVRFTTELPEEPFATDIVVLSGVLQFVEDYEELLTKLARFKASQLLLAFLPAGDIPTFVSAQRNVPGSILPVWFFNVGELIRKVEAFGYKLVFKSALDRAFDMGNFPPTHQLHRQCNLLFRYCE